ncbi:Rne/Rng family ribonuclease [Parvularcula flava]|uniref:Ribonuclease E n=1 Tax=Aquisalinus luteolus TaxID=1566827 RepID=A0A8J3A202_9PROT|nr:ribonuclease E/G [Aquisalinus luteolus]NHK27807.1 Rne/Rng family ribonuclease [Aquisalinus luteolus]GGH96561.1 ribonuclease E [Aquisalinus luteolus]
MPKKMLIDASHREETRVAVISNGKVEDFDFESESRKPLRGNIYLARVTRVEPSLQAAFVEYGGNRHGFLAFSEIHSDYYQIPVSDRDILRKAEELEAELAAQMVAEEQEDLDLDDDSFDDEDSGDTSSGKADKSGDAEDASDDDDDDSDADIELVDTSNEEVESLGDDDEDGYNDDDSYKDRAALIADATSEEASEAVDDENDDSDSVKGKSKAKPEKSLEERYREARRERVRLLRNYRIQEVIKRRQILLVQVVKEERGNKGAALTTYLSLAGRYCVLMPNTSRGGGISRKITNGADRKRLRKTMSELEIPPGLGLIIRTAGSKRTKSEIKRDYDYLLRLWENIRDLTLRSIAPCLIYEEASLIKRAIRDLYDKDISSILVQGEAGYREAKDFMKMLMPSHAKNVQPYRDQVPMFLATKTEQQLDEMYQPVVKLKSGGYLVIQQTEALISIDVNSGKATKERNIEATALKTNCEAAVEVARQCRLRDLAGLVVVDFIDMEENRNNRTVEKKLKDAMKTDRARIQLGRISTFGLLEMSRQRRRSGIVDGTTRQCPTCHGAGAIRSHEMAALRILRSIEEEALAGRAGVIAASTSTEVALYILNNKREWLNRIEETYALTIEINADPDKAGDTYEIEKRGPAREMPARAAVVTADLAEMDEPEADAVDEEEDDTSSDDSDEDSGDEKPRRRRRRRGRGKSSGDNAEARGDKPSSDSDSDEEEEEKSSKNNGSSDDDNEDGGGRRRRRRGRRGGRRNRKRNSDTEAGSDDKTDNDGQKDAASEDTAEKAAVTEPAEASSDDDPASKPANDANGDASGHEESVEKAAVAEEQKPEPTAEPEDKAPVTNPDAEPEQAAAASTEDDVSPAGSEPEEKSEEKSTASPTAGNDDDDDRPKRTGWWQRALGKD